MADSPEKKKRKRDVKEGDSIENEARITYHTPYKTFERLFNEASLDDTKRVVRAKLGLAPSVNVELAQLRGGRKIVLEDEDDFHAFCVTLRANPQVEVEVTLPDTPHSFTYTEITAPAAKKRRTKESVANVNASTSSHNPAAAYATPANSKIHPSIAFSASSIASIPPSSTSPSNSTSPPTITSPLLAFPSVSAPFSLPTFATVPPVRNLPPATGVFGPAPKGSGKDKKKEKVNDKDAKKDTDDEEGEEQEKEKKKEKPKRVRKKSEAASAPSAPMSPAARAKAAAILERHRQSIAERAANPPPRKRPKKVDPNAEVKESTKDSVTASKTVEETSANDEDVEQDEDEDKSKKEKRKKKKKKHAEAEQDQDDEEAAREESPAKTAREESPAKSTQEESSSKEKKGRKKKDKERSSPVRASVASGTLAVEDDGAVGVDMEDVWGLEKNPVVEDKSKRKSKPSVAAKVKLVPVITRPADASTILNAKKGDRAKVVSSTVHNPIAAQTIQAPSTSSTKQPVSISIAKLPPPPALKGAADEDKAPSISSNTSKTSKKGRAASPQCPICLAPFHLRFKCPLLQSRGPAMFRRLAELERTGHADLARELLGWLETERKRDQLRALGKSGTIGKGAKAVVSLDGDDDEANGLLKKRLMSFESEERDEPEEKEVGSDVLGDSDTTEEDEDDEDEDAREDSVPASLGRPTTSKPSLVSVQKPGEGSETSSSDSEEDEDMEPIVQDENEEDDDEEMQDANRNSTPQGLSAKHAGTQETSSSSDSSSTRSDSPSQPDKRKANTLHNKSAKPTSTARSPHTFRGINDQTEGQATDAVHQRMQRDTAKVLVPNSDDSGDEEMIEAGEDDETGEEEGEEEERPHTPNGDASERRLSMETLMQRRESPVAKGRAPGTPSRIQVMKDRHGNTAPVQRSYGGDGTNGDEFSPPRAHPFPNHKLQSASQPSALSSRIPRLSELSASLRNVASNMFKGTLASSPTAQGLPTPISVPPSGRVPKRDTAKDFSDESTSSSSSEFDSDSGRGASRVPKRQRARAIPPKKSRLELM